MPIIVSRSYHNIKIVRSTDARYYLVLIYLFLCAEILSVIKYYKQKALGPKKTKKKRWVWLLDMHVGLGGGELGWKGTQPAMRRSSHWLDKRVPAWRHAANNFWTPPSIREINITSHELCPLHQINVQSVLAVTPHAPIMFVLFNRQRVVRTRHITALDRVFRRWIPSFWPRTAVFFYSKTKITWE